jgi:hypothetical protein
LQILMIASPTWYEQLKVKLRSGLTLSEYTSSSFICQWNKKGHVLIAEKDYNCKPGETTESVYWHYKNTAIFSLDVSKGPHTFWDVCTGKDTKISMAITSYSCISVQEDTVCD